MSRYRLEICKGEEVRFLSHLDFMKAFERTFRRSGIPVALSEGYNPHPKISFGSALPVGVSSECELVDIELKEEMSESELQSKLERSLPPGITVNSISQVDKKEPAIMAVVNRAEYNVYIKSDEMGISGLEVNRILEEFMSRDCIMVEKWSKKGTKEVNIRPGVYKLQGDVADDEIEIKMNLQTGSRGNVKPSDVLVGLKELGLPVDPEVAKIHRTYLSIE